MKAPSQQIYFTQTYSSDRTTEQYPDTNFHTQGSRWEARLGVPDGEYEIVDDDEYQSPAYTMHPS